LQPASAPLRQLLPSVHGVLSEEGKPLVSGETTNEPGLYFCGLTASPTGQLREIGFEATRIGDLVRKYLKSNTPPSFCWVWDMYRHAFDDRKLRGWWQSSAV